MKIVLMLFCCTLLALAIMALPSHQASAATAATNPYTPSADLVDAMSSHGIEAAASGGMESVAYRPEAGSQ